jgi:hypothetical protein
MRVAYRMRTVRVINAYIRVSYAHRTRNPHASIICHYYWGALVNYAQNFFSHNIL